MENKIKNITVATANPNKLKEINAINKYKNIVFSLVKGEFNPEETGSTFSENAYIKASCASKIMQNFSIADDSGLCVDALNGAPGLFSARYAGTQQQKIQKLIAELQKFPKEKRTAHFISSMVLTDKNGNILYKTEGIIKGIITDTPKGNNGFGYDPIFFIPEYNQTMAEMNSDLKNSISHRANSLIPMLEWINKNL